MEIRRRSFLGLIVGGLGLAALPVEEALPPPMVITPDMQVIRYVLPFSSYDGAAVRPGEIILLEAIPQKPFRPTRLILDSTDYDSFNLLSVSASGEAQLEEEIPASLFSPLSVSVEIQCNASLPGERIVLAAVNRGKSVASFRAAMIGDFIV